MLINYGDEWQKAWDDHVKSFKPIDPESDFNNLTLWTEEAQGSGGAEGYVRSEALNEDTNTPIRTIDEQAQNPYHQGKSRLLLSEVYLILIRLTKKNQLFSLALQLHCTVNLNHRSAYLSEPETIPFFKRAFDPEVDAREDTEEKHVHICNVKERWIEEEDSEDEEEDEEDDGPTYLYTIEVEVQKQSEDLETITERHEITDVPRGAIEFANLRYSSDVFLKQAFRHEMKLPDSIFPKAWMNLIPKEEENK